ncbi:hypothetical protein TSOC_009103, partial [Tetrabaena socialis]
RPGPQVRFRKFWDLMNERARPWHFDAVLHLCAELSPYSCSRYAEATAGTMQGILAQRAMVEKEVRDWRQQVGQLRWRLTRAVTQMQWSGRPAYDDQLSMLLRMVQQIKANVGITESKLRKLQLAASWTYQDREYEQHVEALLPLLKEADRVCDRCWKTLLPRARALQAELASFQKDMDARRLPRDRALAFLKEVGERQLLSPDDWPPLTADEAVEWRYPPMPYWAAGPGDGAQQQEQLPRSHAGSVATAALRAPKHAYGGPTPFGTGAGIHR